MSIHLTREAVRTAALQAYRDGRLGFQMTAEDLDHDENACRYRYADGVHCCGIGAALPDDLAERFDHLPDGSAIADLMRGGRVTTDDDKFLRDLQGAHDVLAHVRRNGHDPRDDVTWPDFLRLIGADEEGS